MADFEKSICSIDGCNNFVLAKGFCNAHYIRNRNGKDMTKKIQVMDGSQGCKVDGCHEEHYGLGCCKRHYKSEQRKQRWEFIIQMKGGCCQRCGISYHYSVYDLHHREPDKKDFSVGSLIGSVSFERLLEEADKCDLLCSNCHRLTHFTYGEL